MNSRQLLSKNCGLESPAKDGRWHLMRWWTFILTTSFFATQLIFSTHQAQSDEAIQLTERFGVGARAMGMGGTGIAVAEDFSALYWNPAGLAQVPRIEISGGLSHQKYSSSTVFYGTSQEDNEKNTRFNALGLVFPVPTYRGSLVFALGMGRDRNFDALFVQRGFSNEENWWQDGREIQSGGLFVWSLGGAVDVSPTLSLGAALNLWDGDYNYDWNTFFADTRNIWEIAPNDYDSTYIHDTKEADFDALSAKLGGLLRLSRFWKVGMTIASPVSYDISGDVILRTTDVFDDGGVDEYKESYYFQNEITTPWEFGLGMAWSVPTFLLAGDLRYTDWSQMKFNDQPLDDYQETFSWGVGGEYIIPRAGVKMRAGYASEPIAYAIPHVVEDRHDYTLGAGFLVGQVMTLDVAWMRGSWKTTEESLTEENQVERIFLTMAYRF